MTDFREATVPLTDLLLDPNNYRYHDSAGFVAADEARFHEESVQDAAFKRLRDDSLVQLKNSILKNGFLPVDRVIVRAYSENPPPYVVFEGNRRVAALRWIAEDNDAGVTIPKRVLDTLSGITVMVVKVSEDDPAFFEALMGIRHVSGINEWGGFQRAKLVAVLRNDRHLESAEIADRLGMRTLEVNRRYRAFQALEQMRNDGDFGFYAGPEKYPLFHEAVDNPLVREWLAWDDREVRFTDEENLQEFYRLISPDEPDEGPARKPKIETREQVRDLKDIIPNTEAKRVLLDPAHSYLDALVIAKRDEMSHTWRSQVSAVINILGSISLRDLKQMSDEDLTEIEKLKSAAAELLENFRKITA